MTGDAYTTVRHPAPVLEFLTSRRPFSAAPPISYHIVLKNTGNLFGTILLTDTLPFSATLIGGTLASSQPPLPAVSGQQLTWSGVISAGASVQITYALTPTVELLPGAHHQPGKDRRRRNAGDSRHHHHHRHQHLSAAPVALDLSGEPQNR
jgi:hypothetical protein